MSAKIAKMFGGEGYERSPHDNYRTPPWVTDLLLSKVKFQGPIWEPAAGDGDMAAALRSHGLDVFTSDIRHTGTDFDGVDFTGALDWRTSVPRPQAVITNPPFGIAADFIRRALEVTKDAVGQVALLLPYEYDAATVTRGWAFRDCPAFAAKIVLGRRISWIGLPEGSPRQVHAWYLWDHRRNRGDGFPAIIYA